MQPGSNIFTRTRQLLSRPKQGDRLAAQIERRILSPITEAYPAAAPLVEAVRRCGGCTHAQHQLGSDQPHPDADAPIV